MKLRFAARKPPSAVRQRQRLFRIVVILILTPPLWVFELRHDSVLAVVFSPDGQYISSMHGRGPNQRWQVATGRRITSREEHGWLGLGPEAKCSFAAHAEDREVVLLFAAGQHSIRLRGHQGPVRDVAISPDCALVASASDDGTVRLWSVASGKELWRAGAYAARLIVRGPANSVQNPLLGLCYMAWFVAGFAVLFLLVQISKESRVHALAISRDAETLGIVFKDVVFLLERATGKELWSRGVVVVVGGYGLSFLESPALPDKPALAQTGAATLFRSLDCGKVLRRVNAPSGWAATVSLDGRLVASGGATSKDPGGSLEPALSLVEVATGQVRNLQGHLDPVRSVAFNSDASLLASGSGIFDKTVRLWETATGKQQAVLTGHRQTVTCLAFSPDGSLLASGSDDLTVRLWDVAGAQERARLEGHTGAVTSVAFSPDGRCVASCSADTTVRLWEAATGKELRRMEGHTKKVNALAFSPDGAFLVSGGDDKTVRAWDPATGAQLWQLTAKRVGIFGYRFERS